MFKTKLVSCWTTCALLAGLAYGQAPATPQSQATLPNPKTGAPAAAAALDMPALRVAVTQVSESRNSTGSGSISLTLGISGEGLPPNAVVRQVTVTKAVDAADRPIPPGRVSPVGSSMMMMNSMMGSTSPVMRASASLGSAPRSTESLKYVEGTIEIFIPSEATGSIVRVPFIKSHPGKVEDPILAKYGIVFHFLADKASGDEARALMASTSSATAVEFNGVTAVGFYYRDPSTKMGGYQLQDARGNIIRTSGGGGGGSAGSLMSGTLQAPLPEDAQLVIFVIVPEAIKTVPFRVEDITLP